jgi:hypothetical protein
MDTDKPETDLDRDRALEDSFPASDPPSTGGSTGPNDTPPHTPPRTPLDTSPWGNNSPLAQGRLPAQD